MPDILIANSLNVFVGKVKNNYGFETAIDKQAVSGPVYLSELGLAGDMCADPKHHGGIERALHQYPAEHYAYWQQEYGSAQNWQAPGMGENISTLGMTEENVCIGDQYQWGEAIIEVSQPRSPCYKLNQRWHTEAFSVRMQDISRCGWLYRVLQPGFVSADDKLTLISRPDNAMTVQQVCNIFFGDPLNQAGLLALTELKALSASWTQKAELRLATNEVENWNFRLLGHA